MIPHEPAFSSPRLSIIRTRFYHQGQGTQAVLESAALFVDLLFRIATQRILRSVMPIDVIHINTRLPLNCFKAKSGDWIGECEPLGITIQAETWSELMEDIGYTLDAMFQDLLTSNELDRFLRDHGWEAVGQIPTQPDRAVRFDVPFIPALVGTPA